MKKVIEEQTVLTENMKQLLEKVDFSDTFSTTNHVNSMEEVSNLIFNTAPRWVNAMFKLRNKIARPFGLKSALPGDYNDEYKVGGYVKFFQIFSIDKKELILGANDSHLNFRAVIVDHKSEMYNIKVTTLVEYNNRKGRIYMGLIKPFHRQIVKRMVKNAFIEK